MMAGYVNGNGAHNGPGGDGKVASLDEARRRATARAKEEKRKPSAGPARTMTARDWVIGVMIVAMAIGMVWHWFSPLVGATGAVR